MNNYCYVVKGRLFANGMDGQDEWNIVIYLDEDLAKQHRDMAKEEHEIMMLSIDNGKTRWHSFQNKYDLTCHNNNRYIEYYIEDVLLLDSVYNYN